MVMTVVTVLVLAAYFTPLLGVRSVEVSGATTIPQQQLRDAADVPLGQPMLRVDVDAIRQRLQAVPQVRSADVMLAWPSTVRLDVVERTPAVFMLVSNGIQLIDEGGVPFATVPQWPDGLPELRVPHASPDDPATRVAMSVLTSLPPAIRVDVTTVTAETPRDVRFQLRGQREVRWGDSGESRRKVAILPALLTRPGHVYDVTAPDLPTVS